VSFFLWNNKQAKKFGAWRSVGSFVHSSLHTLQVCGFSYSNSWNVVLVFPVVSFWMWSVVLWFLVFFLISGSVLWFTLAFDQSKSGHCRHVFFLSFFLSFNLTSIPGPERSIWRQLQSWLDQNTPVV
jgi:hypothetical protein